MKKLSLKVISLSLLISLTSLSNAQEAIPLSKGEGAPFTGILLSPDKANELRRNTIELDNSKKIIESYEKSVKLYTEMNVNNEARIKAIMERNDTLSKNLQDERSMTTWERLGWFSLGVLGVWGASQVVR